MSARTRPALLSVTLLVAALLAPTVFLPAARADGTTVAGGGIYSDTEWTLAGSPYSVTSSLIVVSGVALTIDPGVVVRFAPGAGLEVRGAIFANGASDARIQLTSADPGQRWAGVNMRTDLGASGAFRSIDITYAQTAISEQCCWSGGPLTLSDGRLTDDGVGIGGYAGWPMLVDHTLFANDTNGVNAADKTISNSTFVNNVIAVGPVERTIVVDSTLTGNQVAFNGRVTAERDNVSGNDVGFDGNGGFSVQHSTIAENRIGLTIGYETPTIHQNDIVGNTQLALDVRGAHDVDVSQNYWGTTSTDGIEAQTHDGRADSSLGNAQYQPFLVRPQSDPRPDGLAAPSAPTSLQASPGPIGGDIILSWSAPSTDGGTPVQAYRVYRDDGTGPVLVGSIGNDPSFDDTGLPLDETFTYAVTAVNEMGEGSASGQAASAASTPPSGPTSVSGTIASARWYAAASPYLVSATVVLRPQATLTIEPGVVAKFDPGTSLEIRGALRSMGNDAAHVELMNSTNARWQGIVVRTDLGGSAQLQDTDVSGASTGVLLNCCWSGGPVSIDGGSFHDDGVGISGYAGWTTTIDNVTFANDGRGIDSADKLVRNSTFTNDGVAVGPVERTTVVDSTLSGNQVAFSGRVNAQRDTVTGNDIGFDGAGGYSVRESTIANNRIGLAVGYETPTIQDNDIMGNAQGALVLHASRDLDVTRNYWGSTSTADIDAAITDASDDAGLGVASYIPFLSRPHAEPTPPGEQPPSDPTDLTAAPGAAGGDVVLTWNAPLDNDPVVEAYRIYRWDEQHVLQPIATVGNAVTSYDDAGLPLNATQVYAVAAINEVGEGVRSLNAQATPQAPPPGPTYVNAFRGNAHWYASASPYVANATLVVPSGRMLSIDGGVQATFAPGAGLEVRGSVFANGTSDARIQLTSADPGERWAGVNMRTDLGASGAFRSIDITHASTAISEQCCWSGGPLTLSDGRLTDDGVGIGGYAGWPMLVDHTLFANDTNGVNSADKAISNSTFVNNVIAVGPVERTTVVDSTLSGNQVGFSGRVTAERDNVTGNDVGFDGSGGFSVQHSTIADNRIGLVIGYETPSIHQNDITENTEFAIQNHAARDVDVTGNYWGTTNASLIEPSIYDADEDATLGVVHFVPFLDAPWEASASPCPDHCAPACGSCPDLTATLRPVGTIHAGDAVTFAGYINNIADARANADPFEFELDGARIAGASASQTSGVNGHSSDFFIAGWTATQGDHTIRLVADPNGEVQEQNESNNADEITFTVSPAPAGLPDLTATLRSLGTIHAGDAVTFAGYINNIADARANADPFEFELDGVGIAGASASQTSGVNGHSSDFFIAGWTATQGAHTIRLVADPNGEVQEQNESNNVDEIAFTVAPAAAGLPDLTATLRSLGTIHAGDAVTFAGYINNIADARANADPFEFELDGVGIAGASASQTSGVNGHSSDFFIADWTATQGAHTIRLVADPNGEVQESNESNNVDQIAFVVDCANCTPPPPPPAFSLRLFDDTGSNVSQLSVLAATDLDTHPVAQGYHLRLQVTGSDGSHPTTSGPDRFGSDGFPMWGDALPPGPRAYDASTGTIDFGTLIPTRVGGSINFQVTWRGVTQTLQVPITQGAQIGYDQSVRAIPTNTSSDFTVNVNDRNGNPIPNAKVALFANPQGTYSGLGITETNGTGGPGNGQNGRYTFHGIDPTTSGTLVLYAQLPTGEATYGFIAVGTPEELLRASVDPREIPVGQTSTLNVHVDFGQNSPPNESVTVCGAPIGGCTAPVMTAMFGNAQVSVTPSTTGALDVRVENISRASVMVCDQSGCGNSTNPPTPPVSFQADITATASDGSADFATFGFSPNATGGYDPGFDSVAPPAPPGNATQAFFEYPQNANETDRLHRSYVPETDDVTFPLRVHTVGPAGVVALTWDASQISALDADHAIFLVDGATFVNMREQTSYTFTKTAEGSDLHDLQIHVAAGAALVVNDSDVFATPVVKLGANVTVSASVRNEGGRVATNVTATLSIDGSPVANVPVAGALSPGEDATFAFPGVPQDVAGAHVATVMVSTDAPQVPPAHPIASTSFSVVRYLTSLVPASSTSTNVELRNDTSYQFVLTNVGDATDTFDLSGSSNASGWSFTLAPTRATLGPNASTNVTLTVHAPTSYRSAGVPQAGIVVQATSENESSSSERATTTTTLVAGYTFSLNAGWNLISFAVVPDDARTTSIFGPAVDTNSIYTWDQGGYVQAATVAPGHAYWVLANAAEDDAVHGVAQVQIPNVQLQPGWDLIGGPIYALDAPAAFGPDVIAWNGTAYAYGNTIQPGVGYWVHLDANAPRTAARGSSMTIASLALPSIPNDPTLALRIDLAAGLKGASDFVIVGTAAHATSAYDAGLDSYMAPAPAGGVYAQLGALQGDANGALFHRAIQAASKTGSWTLAARTTDTSGIGRLSWSPQQIARIPAQDRVELIDGANHIDMRASSAYPFQTAPGATRTFEIVITPIDQGPTCVVEMDGTCLVESPVSPGSIREFVP